MQYEVLDHIGLFDFTEASPSIDNFFEQYGFQFGLNRREMEEARDLVHLNAAEASLPPLREFLEAEAFPVVVGVTEANTAIHATDCLPFGGWHPRRLSDVPLFASDAQKLHRFSGGESLEDLHERFGEMVEALQGAYLESGDAAGQMSPIVLQLKTTLWRAKLGVLIGAPITLDELGASLFATNE